MAGLLFVVMVTRSVTLIVLVLLQRWPAAPSRPACPSWKPSPCGTSTQCSVTWRSAPTPTSPSFRGRGCRRGVGTAFGVVSNNREIAELLLANGADINIPASDEVSGFTTGMGGLLRGKRDGHILIAEGADLNSKNALGGTPLDATTAENPFILVGQLETFNKSRAFLRMLLIERGAESGFPEMSLLGAIDREDLAAVEDHLASGRGSQRVLRPAGSTGRRRLRPASSGAQGEQGDGRSPPKLGYEYRHPSPGPVSRTATGVGGFFGLTEMVVFLWKPVLT